MARLQILQLPEGASDERAPFVLVIDQAPADESGFEALLRDLANGNHAEKIGARAVFVFEGTYEIPANEIPAGPLLRATEHSAANVRASLNYVASQYGGSPAAQRLDLCRQALVADGYFTPDEIGDDIAPRLTEWLSHHRGRLDSEIRQRREFVTRLLDALGLDNDPAVDLVGAAHAIRSERDQLRAGADAVRSLHRWVESPHSSSPGIICTECSGYDGDGSCDSAPIAHPCATVTALNTQPAAGEQGQGNG